LVSQLSWTQVIMTAGIQRWHLGNLLTMQHFFVLGIMGNAKTLRSHTNWNVMRPVIFLQIPTSAVPTIMMSGNQTCVSASRLNSLSQEYCFLLQCWLFAFPEATHFLSRAVSRIQCQLKEVQNPVGKGGLVRIFCICSRSRRRREIYVKRQSEAGNWRQSLNITTIFLFLCLLKKY